MRRRFRPDILLERLRWAGPDLPRLRWVRRGERRRRGWWVRVLNTTSWTRQESSRGGSREAE